MKVKSVFIALAHVVCIISVLLCFLFHLANIQFSTENEQFIPRYLWKIWLVVIAISQTNWFQICLYFACILSLRTWYCARPLKQRHTTDDGQPIKMWERKEMSNMGEPSGEWKTNVLQLFTTDTMKMSVISVIQWFSV